MGEAQGYVVVIRNAALLLDQQAGERDWFAEAMADCAAVWAKRGTPFRVVLQDATPPGLAAVALTLDDESPAAAVENRKS